MRRPMCCVSGMLMSILLLSTALVAGAATNTTGTRTLVLPFRTLGVSDTTALVSSDLLVGSLEDLGMTLVHADASQALPSGPQACAAPECAAELARAHSADLVLYGTLTRLGGKVIARLNVLRVGESAPYYRDQLTSTSEDDLDTVMRRFAEGIASGRPNSDRATVESVTQAETVLPPRRATRSGAGLRAGFLFPTGDGYGGASRLTSLRSVYRYEFDDFQIETTPGLGLAWGDGNADWTLLDIGAARIVGRSDMSGYLGGSLGVHSVTVQRMRTIASPYPGNPTYSYDYPVQQTETVPTVDLVAGFMALRTYDFVMMLELRYHHVFEKFDRTGGGGAQGLSLTIGTSH